MRAKRSTALGGNCLVHGLCIAVSSRWYSRIGEGELSSQAETIGAPSRVVRSSRGEGSEGQDGGSDGGGELHLDWWLLEDGKGC